MKFDIYSDGALSPIIYEKDSHSGVKKIADRFALDIELTCGKKPDIFELSGDDVQIDESRVNAVIFVATFSKSNIIENLIKNGNLSTSDLSGKRECYVIKVIDEKDAKIVGLPAKKTLLILGSDKRGTIYGMFKISEKIGVTSLVYYGDSKPEIKDDVKVDIPLAIISKEPSIEYRGFFINDEWPAFGNWCNEQFGGFNAKCYEEIFIFLLRMKGNFLWPAMWSAIFSEDGPSTENARLADELGVVMGTSHHEPLFRAGEEWQKIYSNYGDSNAWSFISNKEAITNFWIDGVERNKDFESLVTIGMRGEADSKLLPENATMADNIKVVMDAINAQNKILKEHMNEDLKSIPRVLAIYKEVEDYYYGDKTAKGLKDYEELSDVIFLLSDDNWANTRGLPTLSERNHKGGYGMYYHFDYHGDPISYEWQNTTRLSKVNEQLMGAYNYGVRKLWIVNVGDVKGYEFPLTYFMDLAYDIEAYGEINQLDDYMSDFVDTHLPSKLTKKTKSDLLYLIENVTRLNAVRKPESLNQNTYSPVNYCEAERMVEKVDELIRLNQKLEDSFTGNMKTAYESLFYYQFAMSLDILGMQLEAGINNYLAKGLDLMANVYTDRVKNRILRFENLMDRYNASLNGKWNHMLDSGFTGLRNWCDTDWGYPTTVNVTPIRKGKIMAMFKGDTRYHLGYYWQDGEPICNEEFMRPDTKEVTIYLDSRGDVDFSYEIECDKTWAQFDKKQGKVKVSRLPREEIKVTVDRRRMEGEEKAYIHINVKFANGESTVGNLAIKATDHFLYESVEYDDTLSFTEGARMFAEADGYISMLAEHFTDNNFVGDDGYRVIHYLGREKGAVKCLPETKDYTNEANRPYLRYDFVANSDGQYIVEADVLARNPVVKGQPMTFGIKLNDGEMMSVNTVVDDYYANGVCRQWANGVLDNVRRISTEVTLKKGVNRMYIYAMSPNVMFDKFIVYNKEKGLKESYLGPEESFSFWFE